MPWPLSQDYNETIQNPAHSFADPELKQTEAVTNALGLPQPCSGNFADVYAVQAGSRKWAVKCFTRQIPGLQERYVQISKYLQQVNLPFMVDFSFLQQGIRVRGEWYPVLKMQWVQGYQLNTFVKDNVDKLNVLNLLCQLWARMAGRLREANLAHGDLEHGNVLLVPGSKAGSLAVKLVDYDGMCVPALELLKSIELGHACYQHPQRLKEGCYGLHMDHFSQLVIHTALRALTVGGRSLWEKYDNGDNLLFTQKDFESPGKSALFQELLRLNDAELRAQVQTLATAAQTPIERTPVLDEEHPQARPSKAQYPVSDAFAPPPDRLRTARVEDVFCRSYDG